MKKDSRVLRTIEELRRQSLPRNHYELILVENGSDELRELVPADIVYCQLSRASMPAARNVGLRMAHGEFVLFTDSDCIPNHEWIASIIAALQGGEHAAVGGRIESFAPITAAQRFASNIVNGQRTLSYLPALHLPYVAGANAGFRRSVLLEVGGFDEALLSGNDVDVCYKIGLRGFSIGLADNAVVLHDNRATVGSHFRRFYNYARFQVLLFKKYKAISRKSFVFNTYPWRLAFSAIVVLPIGIALLTLGKPDLLYRSFFDIIEAAGVLCGDIRGSFEFGDIYI